MLRKNWQTEYDFCQSQKDFETATAEYHDVLTELGFWTTMCSSSKESKLDFALECSERIEKLTKAFIECCVYPGRPNIFPFDDSQNDFSGCVIKDASELTDPNRRYRVEEPTIQERMKPGYECPRKKYTDTQNRMWRTEALKKKANAQQKRKRASDVRFSKRLSKKTKN